jgi:hypothetical protein
MVIAVTTGYAFEEHIENGGHGLKIMMHQVQGARIAKKCVRAGRKTQQGQQVYDGEVIREKGDVYMIDCNVTGSDAGTSDKSSKVTMQDHTKIKPLSTFASNSVKARGGFGNHRHPRCHT